MSRKSFVVPVEPEILIWARTSIGMDEKDVAKKIKGITGETVKNWEKRLGKPTFLQIERLAFIYKRPLAVFLLSKPPEEPQLPTDYRTADSVKHKPLTSRTLLVIRKARRLQQSALELNKELDRPVTPFPIKATLSDKPEIVAQKIREKIVPASLNISILKNSEEAFELWKSILEDNGVFIFQINIQQREIKGFSITEGTIPAITVNKNDEWNSKIFSLFHELAHILLNKSGICDMIEDDYSPEIEKFCNHFAGTFLVPSNNLLAHILVRQNNSGKWDNKTLNIIASQFRTSKEVILRRLLVLKKTTNDFYKQWREKYIKDYRPFGKRKKDSSIKARIQERGKKYVSMVFTAYEHAKISPLDTADYLGVKINQIPEVHEMISK